MRKALLAFILSPFLFAGSAGNAYRQTPDNILPDTAYILTVGRKMAEQKAYAAAEKIDSIYAERVYFIGYSDLDKRPDGRVFRWDTWFMADGDDTIYTHTEI